MNAIIKPYDPIDEAIMLFNKYNAKPEESEYTEQELIQLVAHRVKQYEGT